MVKKSRHPFWYETVWLEPGLEASTVFLHVPWPLSSAPQDRGCENSVRTPSSLVVPLRGHDKPLGSDGSTVGVYWIMATRIAVIQLVGCCGHKIRSKVLPSCSFRRLSVAFTLLGGFLDRLDLLIPLGDDG